MSALGMEFSKFASGILAPCHLSVEAQLILNKVISETMANTRVSTENGEC